MAFDSKNIRHVDHADASETVPPTGGKTFPFASHQHRDHADIASASTVRREEECDSWIPREIDKPRRRREFIRVMLNEREGLFWLKVRVAGSDLFRDGINA